MSFWLIRARLCDQPPYPVVGTRMTGVARLDAGLAVGFLWDQLWDRTAGADRKAYCWECTGRERGSRQGLEQQQQREARFCTTVAAIGS